MINHSIKNNKGIISSISVDFVSAPFMMDRINLYEGYEDPTHFFRPAIRSMLVNLYILCIVISLFLNANNVWMNYESFTFCEALHVNREKLLDACNNKYLYV